MRLHLQLVQQSNLLVEHILIQHSMVIKQTQLIQQKMNLLHSNMKVVQAL